MERFMLCWSGVSVFASYYVYFVNSWIHFSWHFLHFMSVAHAMSRISVLRIHMQRIFSFSLSIGFCSVSFAWISLFMTHKIFSFWVFFLLSHFVGKFQPLLFLKKRRMDNFGCCTLIRLVNYLRFRKRAKQVYHLYWRVFISHHFWEFEQWVDSDRCLHVADLVFEWWRVNECFWFNNESSCMIDFFMIAV